MQGTGCRQKVVVGAFGANARLDGVPVDAQRVLRQRKLFTTCYQQLPLHQIKTCDCLGHRVLDLKPCIHLHKVKLHGGIRTLLNNEFNRACTHIADRTRCSDSSLTHLLAHRLRHAGRRGFLQHLLMATLYRAVTLEQVNVVAMRIAKHLNFNVARAQCVFFNQHVVVAKAVDGFAFAGRECCVKFLCAFNRAHALATTTRAGLDQHRVANPVGFALEQVRVLVTAVVAGHQRYAGFFHQLLRLGLQTHSLDGRWWWANKDQTSVRAGLRKLFVFTQKAIARVDRLCACGLRRFNDALPAQVTVFGGT